MGRTVYSRSYRPQKNDSFHKTRRSPVRADVFHLCLPKPELNHRNSTKRSRTRFFPSDGTPKIAKNQLTAFHSSKSEDFQFLTVWCSTQSVSWRPFQKIIFRVESEIVIKYKNQMGPWQNCSALYSQGDNIFSSTISLLKPLAICTKYFNQSTLC